MPNQTEAVDFEELKKYFDDSQIVELVASLALFGYLNRWNDAPTTDLEEYPKKIAENLIGGKGWDVGKHA